MASRTHGGGAGGTPSGIPGHLSYLPLAWLCAVVLLSLNALVGSWPVLSHDGLPNGVLHYVRASMAGDAVIITWGLAVLALGLRRSSGFARAFMAWQGVQILWVVVSEIWVLLVPDVVFTPSALLIAALQVAVGLLCIHLVRRRGVWPALGAEGQAMPAAVDGWQRPPVVVAVIMAVLGVVLGGAAGLGAGLLAGAAIADFTDMSCFEGACGFFALFVGLAGLLAGAVGGGVFAVWRCNRRPR